MTVKVFDWKYENFKVGRFQTNPKLEISEQLFEEDKMQLKRHLEVFDAILSDGRYRRPSKKAVQTEMT